MILLPICLCTPPSPAMLPPVSWQAILTPAHPSLATASLNEI